MVASAPKKKKSSWGINAYVLRPMYVTMKHALRRPVTVLYPFEKLDKLETFKGREPFSVRDMWARFRGLHALNENLCISCGQCAKICPNKCIEMIEVTFPQIDRPKKMPQVNIGRCMFCSLCTVKCPTGALVLTNKYELAAYTREELIYSPERLIRNLPAEKRKAKPPTPKHPMLDRTKCIGCGICAKNCNSKAIEMIEIPGTEKIKPNGTKGKPKKEPKFDYSVCVSCGICADTCPKEALEMKEVELR